MPDNMNVSLFALAAGLAAGMSAGIYFVFSNAVMPALARVDAHAAVAVMQSINREILNRWFLAHFFGTPLLAVLVAVLALRDWHGVASPVLVAAAGLYLVGVFATTMIANVPLNRALASEDAARPGPEEIWPRYVVDWTRWNDVRAASSAFSAVLFLIGARYGT